MRTRAKSVSRVTTIEAGIRPRRRRLGLWERLKDIDMFFQRRSPVHQTMRRLAQKLDKAGIAYAIIGGMAVNAHGAERTSSNAWKKSGARTNIKLERIS